jgi:hypothetical protein
MRDIEVLRFSEDKTSSTFTLETPLSYVSGKDGLSQRIIKLMFTKLGSDIYDVVSGTAFFDVMKVYQRDELESVRATFPVILQALEEQVKKDQIEELVNGKILNDNEILDSLELKSYTWDDIFGGWVLVIEVNTKSGERAYVQIP